MIEVQRGRPPKKERLVPMIVMVSPKTKKQLERQARLDRTSLSGLVRTILDSFHGEFE